MKSQTTPLDVAVATLLFGSCCSACLQDAIIARGRDGAVTDAALADAPSGGLLVEGELIANFERDEDEPESEVRCSVRVSRGGAAVTDAIVTLESSGAPLALSLRDGQFSGSQTGYSAGYTLVVRTGGEEVRAPLSGLSAHRIAAPSNGETVRAAAPLTVRWNPSAAAEATIEAARFSETPVVDTGSFTIPASALGGEAGRVIEERVRVRRSATVALPNFALGSRVRVIVSRENRFSLDAR